MKFIIVWFSWLVLSILSQPITEENRNQLNDNKNENNQRNRNNNNENENQEEDDEDDPNAAIFIMEPSYLETVKAASVSIARPIIFKWEYRGKPQRPPKSLTMTLVENKGKLISHVIAKDLDPKKLSYTWDIVNYKPSDNEDESITLKVGVEYRMYIHDSKLKYDAEKFKGSYRPGHKRFVFFHPSDPNGKFNDSTMKLPSVFITIVMVLTSLLLL